jgi:hypothetical protein
VLCIAPRVIAATTTTINNNNSSITTLVLVVLLLLLLVRIAMLLVWLHGVLKWSCSGMEKEMTVKQQELTRIARHWLLSLRLHYIQFFLFVSLSSSLQPTSTSSTMDALANYSDDDDTGSSHTSTTSTSSSTKPPSTSDVLDLEHPAKKFRVNAAPDVDTTKQVASSMVLHDTASKELYYNPKYQSLARPQEVYTR